MSAQFIGSKISLISKSEIRYEGILYTIDPRESTIALAKVRSFGTEDRSADKPVAPRSEVYEYIIFRASDIKDLLVDDPPAASPPALADPAIIQAQSVAGSASNAFPSSAFASGGSSNITGSASAGQSNKQSTLSSVLGRASPIPGDKSSSRRASPGVRAKSPAGSQSGEHRSGQRNDSNRAPGGYPRTGGSNANNYRNTRQGQSSRAPPNTGNNINNRDNRRNNSQPQSDWPARPAPIGGNRARPRPPMLDVRKLEEFDFEKANAEFVELTKDVEDLKLTEGKEEEPQDDQKKENVETYNKSKSFFDSISCEAIERQKGTMNRVDRRQERKLNQETFGVSGVYNRNWNNRGRGGPGQRNMQGRNYNQGGRGPRNNGPGQGGRYPRNNFSNYNSSYNNNNHNYRSQQGGDRRPQASQQGEVKKSKEAGSENSASAPTVWT